MAPFGALAKPEAVGRTDAAAVRVVVRPVLRALGADTGGEGVAALLARVPMQRCAF